ncbi:MAG: protoporphyrinogen oxidase [Verrucomicrobiota bacterium]
MLLENHLKPVAVIGAGITGLTAAFRLRQKGVPVVVYERGSRVGGVIQTVSTDGFQAECGPNTILETSPCIGELIRDLGLEHRRLYSDPAADRRYLVRDGRLVQLPGSPWQFATSRLFSWRAKLRLLAEPFIRRVPPECEESLEEFVLRRLGREFLDYAINPFVAGVYAGDPAELSVKQAFPKLHALEQRYGSLILGQILGARERKRRQEVSKQNARKLSFDGGLSVLTEALHRRLGNAVKLNTSIRRIARTPQGWRLTDAHGNDSLHSAVLLAGPAHKLAKIDFETAPSEVRALLSPLREIHYTPVASISLGFRREDVAHPLDGFGVLIPEVEQFHLLGTIFTSSLFPNRAPAGYVLTTSYLGGSRAPELVAADPDTQARLATQDLQRLLGVKGRPVFTHIVRFPKAIPQYDVGFGQFRRFMDRFEQQNPGLFLAGHFRDGISLSDSIVSGWNAADRIDQLSLASRCPDSSKGAQAMASL